MTDPRLTPATETVALDTLEGKLTRPAYVPGTPMRVIAPVADLAREPGGRRERQVILGTDVVMIETRGPASFIQSGTDGYCGWIASDALGPDRATVTHRVSAPATHIYTEPSLKSPEISLLTLGSRLVVAELDRGFARLSQGGWVPTSRIADKPQTDPASVAESMAGTPYLWGGNSRSGIDCSGLAQASYLACDIACPGDSDMQESAFGKVDGPIRRGDLLFWPGHVAIALDEARMIHATAYAMGVMVEDIDAAVARIDRGGDGPFLGARRPEIPAAEGTSASAA